MKDVLTLVIAGLSLIVATAALIYTITSTNRQERRNAMQSVLNIAVSNRAEFNGILNTAVYNDAAFRNGQKKRLAELYSETRNAYQAHRGYFPVAVQQEIDEQIDALETAFVSDGETASLYTGMHEIMESIESGSR